MAALKPSQWTGCLPRIWAMPLSFLVPNALIRAAAWTLGVFGLTVLLGLPAYSKPHEQTVPALHQVHRLGLARSMERIDYPPSLQRRGPAQVLVRPQLVVPAAEIGQELIEHRAVVEDELPQTAFQSPEEPLRPPVLPRTVQIGALVADPEQPQPRAEHLSR